MPVVFAIFVFVLFLMAWSAEQRFDCAVLKIEKACEEVRSSYEPKPK